MQRVACPPFVQPESLCRVQTDVKTPICSLALGRLSPAIPLTQSRASSSHTLAQNSSLKLLQALASRKSLKLLKPSQPRSLLQSERNAIHLDDNLARPKSNLLIHGPSSLCAGHEPAAACRELLRGGLTHAWTKALGRSPALSFLSPIWTWAEKPIQHKKDNSSAWGANKAQAVIALAFFMNSLPKPRVRLQSLYMCCAHVLPRHRCSLTLAGAVWKVWGNCAILCSSRSFVLGPLAPLAPLPLAFPWSVGLRAIARFALVFAPGSAS